DEVVRGQPMAAGEPPDTAAEREPADAGRRDEPASYREPGGLRRLVDVGPGRATLNDGTTPRRVDADLAHPREIDHEAAIGRREARQAVTPAAHCDLEVLAAGEPDRGDHVAGL